MTYEAYSQILDLATFAGKIMLESGGEIYRVEQTIEHICKAYGVTVCDSYATPTTIIVSVTNEEKISCTRVRRILARTTDMRRVEAVNDFSRALCVSNPKVEDIAQLHKKLSEIECLKAYSLPIMALASGIGTAAFSTVFGGGVVDFFVGFFVGALVRCLIYYLSMKKLRDLLVNMAGGAACALLCWLAGIIGLDVQLSLLTLSALMLLTPGMRLTNALRDIASGDFVSGLSLLVETFTIAAALACGALFVYAPLIMRGGISI